MKTSVETINYEEIEEEFDQLDWSEFSDMDERLLNIKDKLNNLSVQDRIILLTYAETGSQRETGEIFGVSHSAVYKRIRAIREKLGVI